ncbi:MAG: single-stranded DNA-binding protein [Nitrospirae bacterium]|nr:single-stranded DNA-binding protein [Nitrospirota bacterium]
MADNNSIMLKGRLVKDVEVIQLATGTIIGRLQLAVTNKRKIQGELKENTFIIDVIKGNFKENLAYKLKQGALVQVKGFLEFRRFPNLSWNIVEKWEVVAEEAAILKEEKK